MKLNYKITNHVKIAYDKEISLYKEFLGNKDYANAWHHLERSHIICMFYCIRLTYYMTSF